MSGCSHGQDDSSGPAFPPAFFRRVTFGKDLAQRLDVHFGVNRRGFEAGVAEELLDEADVGPALEEMGRAGMAQCGIRGPVNVSIELQRDRYLESTNGASFLPMRVCLAQGATDSLAPGLRSSAPGLKTADSPTSVE